MKLEVGMYVRTKIYITQIDKIDNNKTVWKYKVDKKDCGDGTFEYCALRDEDIVKASNNIIDLIEVGDYVNGDEVMAISEFKDGSIYIEFDDGRYLCKNYQIKSILTKEQFESMSYKVGE